MTTKSWSRCASYSVILGWHQPTPFVCNLTSYNFIVNRATMCLEVAQTFTMFFRAPTVGGAYMLRVSAGSKCVVTESNETNNQFTVNYDVNAGTSISNTGMPTGD